MLGKKTKRQAFRIQGKSFFLTYPKCPMDKQLALVQLQAKAPSTYVCVSHELHEDGSDHLHALLQTTDKFSSRKADVFDLDGYSLGKFHGNYQTSKDASDVRKYVQKSGDYVEDGEFLSNKQSDLQKRAASNKLIIDTPLHSLIDSGEISIHNYSALVHAKNQYMLDKVDVPVYQPKTCIWIYGDTGIGKSRYIRDTYGSTFFSKPQNKWWDGYSGETVILLDDFDLKGECLGHYLKIWADCYSFNAEIKGGTIKPVITHFYITSQYLPVDIFCRGDDQKNWDLELRKAVERRFTMMTVENGQLVNI